VDAAAMPEVKTLMAKKAITETDHFILKENSVSKSRLASIPVERL
jgi:hypothetical protein